MRSPAGTVWDCPHGHGRFALLAVLRGLVRRSELDAAWRTAFWGRPARGCRCPSCGRDMAEVAVAGVRLDVCRRCQALWLDRAEVQGLPSAERAETRIAAEAGDARRVLAMAQVDELRRRHDLGEAIGGAPDEAWKVAVGILGLPVEIGAMSTRVRPWATWILCAILLALGLLLIAGDLAGAVRGWGLMPGDAFRHGGLTWISSFFIHGGIAHLLGNLWFLWLTGDNVEDAFGWRRFLLLLLAADLAGNLAHVLYDPSAMVPCIGASGGISGIMAAYAVRYPEAQIGQAWFWGRVWLRLPAWAWLGLWLLGQLILAWQQVHGFTNVSAMAHLGGAAAGAGLAWWWGSGDRPAPTPSSS
ncbi:MAG: rhomboid family intramembrane serine protease [Burkholderiales bacterium]|nr:rhomboid family intramembrane serine protease [Burkholderiales bacterium]